MTNLKGVTSVKLGRDLKVRQTTAWYLLHRIREAFADVSTAFGGPVEVDATYVGGKEKNMHQRPEAPGRSRGPVGKAVVVCAKDRATNQVTERVVEITDRETLQGFVKAHTRSGAKVYTDESSAYDGLPNHETVTGTRSGNTSGAWRTRTASRASGRCSSVATTGSITK